MDEFPEINVNQCVIMYSEVKTGTVIDINKNIYISGKHKIYYIYNSFNQALDYANDFCRKNIDVEITIFDNNRNVLKFIRNII